MRETCARALAAALMTGAIATAVGLPSEFQSAAGPERGLTAPPSSLQHTVRVPDDQARERNQRAAVPRSVRRQATGAAARPSVRQRTLAAHPTSRPATPSKSPKQPVTAPTPEPPAATPPAEPPVAAPPPTASTDTRELTSTTPPPAKPDPPAAPAPDESDEGKEKKDKGHDEAGPGDNGNGNDHGNGKGRGHSKED